MNYDLEDRTLKFSKEVIKFLKTIKPTYLNKNIISQVSRSTTSVGANYREANGASSKKDFRNKIHICRKEIQETKYWIELLSELLEDDKQIQELRKIYKEAHELILIFNKISSSLKK